MALTLGSVATAQSFGPVEYGFSFHGSIPGIVPMNQSLALSNGLVVSYLDSIRNVAAHVYQGKEPMEENAQGLAALHSAEELFQQRGGVYRFGPNDCSVFVCDFLAKYNQSVSHRFTTDHLFSSDFMNRLGFVELSSPFRDLQAYDVLVYRYFDVDFMSEGGHCGVLVWKDGKMCVEHNSSSNKGLATTPIDEFYRSLCTRPGLRGPKIFRWAKVVR